MGNFNKKAVSEVIEILNHTDKEIVEKIPQKFINFLFENEDKDYIPNIDFYNEQWEKSIQEDTQSILAIIYRDYIVPEAERLELLEEEKQEREKQGALLREKYNPDNILKKDRKNEDEIDSINNMQLIEIKEVPWYKRLFKGILSIFGIKN